MITHYTSTATVAITMYKRGKYIKDMLSIYIDHTYFDIMNSLCCHNNDTGMLIIMNNYIDIMTNEITMAT